MMTLLLALENKDTLSILQHKTVRTQLLAVYRRLCQINRQRIAERSFADNAVILFTAAKVFKGCCHRVTKK